MKKLVKCLLVACVSFVLFGCDSRSKVEKQVDEEWKTYSKSLVNADKSASLNEQYIFYSCTVFDETQTQRDEKFTYCKNVLGKEPIESGSMMKLYDCKDEKCVIEHQEKWVAMAKKLALYKYDSEFKGIILYEDLSVLYSGVLHEIEQGILSGHYVIAQAKMQDFTDDATKLILKFYDKSSQHALERYKYDIKNDPFQVLWLDNVRYMSSIAKKSAEIQCEKYMMAKCGEMPSHLASMLMLKSMGAAFGGSSQAQIQKEIKQSIINTPYGQCLLKAHIECQAKIIDEFVFPSVKKTIKSTQNSAKNHSNVNSASGDNVKNLPQNSAVASGENLDSNSTPNSINVENSSLTDEQKFGKKIYLETKDLYVNLRESPSGAVLVPIYKKDFAQIRLYSFDANTNAKWLRVSYFPAGANEAIVGYIHASQIAK